MSKISPASTTVILSDGQRLIVEEGDFPEVAKEVFIYFQTRMATLSEELQEILEERYDVAPSMVNSVLSLHSCINYHLQKWLQHHTK